MLVVELADEAAQVEACTARYDGEFILCCDRCTFRVGEPDEVDGDSIGIPGATAKPQWGIYLNGAPAIVAEIAIGKNWGDTKRIKK